MSFDWQALDQYFSFSGFPSASCNGRYGDEWRMGDYCTSANWSMTALPNSPELRRVGGVALEVQADEDATRDTAETMTLVVNGAAEPPMYNDPVSATHSALLGTGHRPDD